MINAASGTRQSGIDERLRAELLRRAGSDQQARQNAPGGGWNEQERNRAGEVDADNTGWLMRLVGKRGWPGASVAGRDGSHAAWLLAQHSDARPDAQHMFLTALHNAAARGEASPADLAYLQDRVHVNNDQPQMYGTQYQFTRNGCEPAPIHDLGQVDARRASVGLGPLAEYDALIRDLNDHVGRSPPGP